MRKFLATVAITALSGLCMAATSEADPVLYKVVSDHYEAEFCKAPALKQEEKSRLISAAMAVSGPGLVYDHIFTPMHYAVIADDVPSVRHLMTVGYSITAKLPPNGSSLLHLSAWSGSNKVAAFLLDHGLDPNATTNSGATPLMVAASEGRVDLVKLLLRHRANARTQTHDGATPLSSSMACRNQALVDLLLSAGAEPDPHAQRLAAKFGLSIARHER